MLWPRSTPLQPALLSPLASARAPAPAPYLPGLGPKYRPVPGSQTRLAPESRPALAYQPAPRPKSVRAPMQLPQLQPRRSPRLTPNYPFGPESPPGPPPIAPTGTRPQPRLTLMSLLGPKSPPAPLLVHPPAPRFPFGAPLKLGHALGPEFELGFAQLPAPGLPRLASPIAIASAYPPLPSLLEPAPALDRLWPESRPLTVPAALPLTGPVRPAREVQTLHLPSPAVPKRLSPRLAPKLAPLPLFQTAPEPTLAPQRLFRTAPRLGLAAR